MEAIDQEFLRQVYSLADQIADSFENFKLRRAVQLIMELAQTGNVYFDTKKPWQDAKKPETRPSMETTLACCLECLKILALTSSPIIPDTAEKVWQMLGYRSKLSEASWVEVIRSRIPAGQKLQEPKILFTRIEDKQIEAEILKLQALSRQHEAQ
jgi:methionyl-tRNA synthetase